jgi:signal transduction histidine kinase
VQDFANDLAATAELQRFAAHPDLAWARQKVPSTLVNTNADALWLLAADGTPLFATARPGLPAPPETPLPPAALRGLLQGSRPPHVFTEHGPRLVELFGAPITAPGQPNAAPPLGWLIVAHEWDQARLVTLSSLTDSEVRLSTTATDTKKEDDASVGIVSFIRPLNDWQGHTLRTLVARHRVPQLAIMRETDVMQARIFLVFGLLVVVALGVGLHAWVLRPLRAIRTSLQRDQPGPLAPLREDGSEFGQVAGLLDESFVQRAALRREIEERERVEQVLRTREAELRRTIEERSKLGRDLHDGVIQTLYATGMGLRGIRTLLTPEQTEAAARLEQTRAALNSTIHDVRNFIIGLEPESLKLQTFAQAVVVLLEIVQGMRPLRSKIDIDETIAARLTLAQRFHALQIAREAISNAIRHGEAQSVRIELQPQGEFVRFEIFDDGRGFDPVQRPGSGHGFSSFTQRARELGAELTLDSAPGQGTSVRLVFSLLSKS